VNTDSRPGDVWFAELGMAEKSRPVLVLAYPKESDARALVVVAPLTIPGRGETACDLQINHHFICRKYENYNRY
jgi:mRNA-degrading endonuclease toxin of MazEF toxin-antitoxin module